MNNLDFYAKIEPVLGIKEAAFRLYNIFLDEIEELNLSGKKVLDFGCGNGNFARILSDDFEVLGLDKSEEMVKKTIENGIKATSNDLSLIDEKFDLITAVSDVINYMNKDELKKFFQDVASHLNNGGFLIFDINTLFGFEEIAQGVLHEKIGNDHLIIDAKFQDKTLKTQMIIFEKNDEFFNKHQENITQYYHKKEEFRNLKNLEFVDIKDIYLYSDEVADKSLIILKKVD